MGDQPSEKHVNNQPRVIAGSAKGRKLKTPSSVTTRPLTDRIKTILFDLTQDFVKGARVLDLFAGSGAAGIEALSRGAHSCVFIDSSEESTAVIKSNLELCRLHSNAKVIHGNLPAALPKDEAFDLIFCDPPYTRLTEFSLAAYASLITETNLFCLRLPTKSRTEQDLLPEIERIEAEMDQLKIEYTREIGSSSLFFLRTSTKKPR